MSENTSTPSQAKKKSGQKSINKQTLRLAKILRFTPKDLHYNRHGVVSREQYKKVVGSIRFWTIIYAIGFVLSGLFGVIFIVVAMNGSFDLIDMLDDGWGIVLLGLLVPAGLLFKLWNNLKAMKVLNTGEAYQYQGSVHKKVEKEVNDRGETTITYTIELGTTGLIYTLSEREYKEFKHGVIYNIYYIPRYKRLLSVEVVGSEF